MRDPMKTIIFPILWFFAQKAHQPHFTSSKSSSRISRNPTLLNDETVQQELFFMIDKFLLHKYAFNVDIRKMRRQTLIEESSRNLQKVVGKQSLFASMKTYKLQTVTYGTSCVQFLATRTLKVFAVDEQKGFPRASSVVLNDTYVDDILSHSDSLEEVKNLQFQLIQLLETRGM
ncbi:integrase catalytic domain-containing protein [Nephila pilipes]|uniref:Integrase catalytic domain-containing protein n=1 Tax=Nephila pilipes TaxID=299642 RepID=A0A8X6J766_NEPPI|nr:integrase catalytic domain-containing protein [Nephila pilipes]